MHLEDIFTIVSTPTVSNIKKNKTLQSCGTGSLDSAYGYTTNTSPGPTITHEHSLDTETCITS